MTERPVLTQPAQDLLKHRYNAAFWIVAYTLTVTMAFTALPTPLYPLYQARDGFSTFMITVIYSVYSVGVEASMPVAVLGFAVALTAGIAAVTPHLFR
jgi:hypothetical protein